MPPTQSPTGARLRERTAPLAPDDAAHGWAHLHLCEALGQVYVQVAEVFDPEGDVPPFAPLLDVELCPAWALPWLGQLVGVQVPPSATDEQARELVRSVAGFKRGTPAAMRAAILPLLTGAQTVYFRERVNGDAYALEVRTRTGETPDPAAVLAALTAAKPAGIVLTYSTVASWDWQELRSTVATWTALKTTYSTWRNVVLKSPG